MEAVSLCDFGMVLGLGYTRKGCELLLDRMLLRGKIINKYNIELQKGYDEISMSIFNYMVQNAKNLNVPNDTGRPNYSVCNYSITYDALANKDWFLDMSKDIALALENKVQVLIYSGDLDFVYNWMGSMAWLHSMKWHGRDAFLRENLCKYEYKNASIGEIKHLENLTFIRVFKAG